MEIDEKGSTEAMLNYRVQAAIQHFRRLQPCLRCKKIGHSQRLHSLYSIVGSTLLWGAGCWTLSSWVKRRLSFLENKWLRSMFASPRGPEEAWPDWYRRSNLAAHKIRHRLGQELFSIDAVRRVTDGPGIAQGGQKIRVHHRHRLPWPGEMDYGGACSKIGTWATTMALAGSTPEANGLGR